MVERNYGIKEHEKRLRNSEDIFHWAGSTRFKIPYAIVPNITNSASRQWRKGKTGYHSLAMSRKFFLKNRKWIDFRAVTGTSLEDIPGILRDQQLTNVLSPCILDKPAPTKLYLPIVSVVAALSKRKESLVFDLNAFNLGTL